MSNKDTPRIPLQDFQTFAGRCKHLYSIQAKSGKTIPFEFIQSQKYIDNVVEQEYKRTKQEFGHRQCRLIILKPRQMGATTYTNIRSLDAQLMDDGSNGVIAAHDKDTTELVYRIYNRAYEELPEHIILTKDGKDLTKREFFKESLSKKQIKQLGVDLSNKEFDNVHHVKVKPETESHSGKQIEFTDTDSLTTIFTAGKGDAGGKGGTQRRIHFTEAGSYSAYNKLLTSINPSVPDFEDGVFFVIESTANGTTGEGEGFYKAWKQNSIEWERYQKGELQTFSGFRPVFVPWYMMEEYELPLAGGKYEDIKQIDFGSKEAKQKFLDREKRMLTEGIYNPLTRQMQVITPEKINWYRWVIKKKCEYSYGDAQRYYPTTPEDAFVASSNCFFDSMKLNEVKNTYLNDGQPESERGDLLWDGQTGDLCFVEDSVGNLKVWEKPDPEWENRYLVSADIAHGYEDGDYSVAYVKDRLKQKIVAYWHGKIDIDMFADKLMEIGIYYNEALLIPERNVSTVVDIIKPSGKTPYVGEIYYEENGHSVKWGYWTGNNRNILLNTYKAWLREHEEGYFVLPDSDTVEEHLSFVRHQKGNSTRYEAAQGKHDDMIISMALTQIGDEWWDEVPKKYSPTNIKNIINKPKKKIKKFIRQHQIGKR